ncbi:hypothetical protein V8F06_009692 [Rhypophila decipiens]
MANDKPSQTTLSVRRGPVWHRARWSATIAICTNTRAQTQVPTCTGSFANVNWTIGNLPWVVGLVDFCGTSVSLSLTRLFETMLSLDMASQGACVWCVQSVLIPPCILIFAVGKRKMVNVSPSAATDLGKSNCWG